MHLKNPYIGTQLKILVLSQHYRASEGKVNMSISCHRNSLLDTEIAEIWSRSEPLKHANISWKFTWQRILCFRNFKGGNYTGESNLVWTQRISSFMIVPFSVKSTCHIYTDTFVKGGRNTLVTLNCRLIFWLLARLRWTFVWTKKEEFK